MVRQLAGGNETYLVPDVRFGSDYLLLASFSNLPLYLIQQWVRQCLVCRELNLVQYSLLLAGTRKERGQPSSILSISEQGSKVGLDNCVSRMAAHAQLWLPPRYSNQVLGEECSLYLSS